MSEEKVQELNLNHHFQREGWNQNSFWKFFSTNHNSTQISSIQSLPLDDFVHWFFEESTTLQDFTPQKPSKRPSKMPSKMMHNIHIINDHIKDAIMHFSGTSFPYLSINFWTKTFAFLKAFAFLWVSIFL